MNRFFPFIALIALVSFSCKKAAGPNSSSIEEPEVAVVGLQPDGGPATDADIAALVSKIDSMRPSMGVKGPLTVEFGKRTLAEATVYAGDQGLPQLIYCQVREVEQWYYLFNRRVVHFRERRPGKKGFEERSWNYTHEKAISGIERIADSPDALAAATAKPLAVKDIAPGETHGVVNKHAFEILFGKLPE